MERGFRLNKEGFGGDYRWAPPRVGGGEKLGFVGF